MTREDAICELSVIWERLSHPEDCENGCYSFRDGDYLEALDMAIEALSADTVSREHHDMEIKELKHQIKDQADMVSVVRCKDCRFAHECHKCVQYTRNEQNTVTIGYSPIEWCSRGERREE